MLVVPPIPKAKNGEAINFGKINHIIKRTEYAAGLLEEFKLQEKIPGNIVGVSRDGFVFGSIINSNPFLFNGRSFSYFNYPYGFAAPRTIRGNLVLIDNSLYNTANGKVIEILPPPALDFDGDIVVGAVQVGIGNDRGYIYNRKSKETTIISHPEYDRTRFSSIDKNTILGYASKFFIAPNAINEISFLYTIGSDPSKKSSYKTLYQYIYLGPNKYLPEIYPFRIRNGFLVGFYRTGATFISGGVSELTAKAYYSTIGGQIQLLNLGNDSDLIQSFAYGISKNFIAGTERDYSVNRDIGFVYNIKTEKKFVIKDPNKSSTLVTDIDIP